ncbi:MAG: T9SS type A sorting domain-containing protein [bacterium]|nr:T9SS type A sorting domain-containing protein [bacterium]
MKKNYKTNKSHASVFKKLAFYIFMMGSMGAFAQNAPINFESGGNGASWTWTTFENSINPPLKVVSNPSSSGINTSSNVAKFTALLDGKPYAGLECAHADIGKFTLSASNSTIKIMVYKSVKSDVGIKFATNSGASTGEIKVANTKINEWEELTFNFAGKIGESSSTDIDQIIVFPDFQTRSDSNVCYFDNITFSAGTATAPTTAAPTPTRLAADVISMFSNAYTNVNVDTWRTSWSAATLTDLQIAGNDTKKYSSLDYVGIETTGANLIDISSMLYFHIDIWTPDITTFRVKIVDFGADAAVGGTDDKEHEVSVTPTQNGWNSFDLALSDFTSLTTKQHIGQLIFSCIPAGGGSVYVDNVFYHKGPVTDPNTPQTAAPTPTFLATDVISMFSNAYTNANVDTWRTSWSAATLTDLQIAGNDTKKYSTLDFVGVETTGANLINASTMTNFYLNAWTPNLTAFKVKLVDFGADGAVAGGDDTEFELTLTAPTLNSWNTYDIPLSSFTGLTNKSHIGQLIFVGNPTGTGTVFIDNVLYRKAASSINSLNVVSVNIYPIPASDVVTITSDKEIKMVNVINNLGQIVLTLNADSKTVDLDISSLSTGVYFLRTTTAEGQNTSKLIVE